MKPTPLFLSALCLSLMAACASSETGKPKTSRPSLAEKTAEHGDESLQKGAVQDAKYRYGVSLRLLQKTDDLKGMATVYLKLSRLSLLEGDVAEARRYLDNALTIIQKEGYEYMGATAALAEAPVLLAEQKADEAVTVLRAAMQKCAPDDKRKLANALGMALLKRLDADGAKAGFEQALSAAAAAKDAATESSARVNIAQLLMKNGDSDGALVHLHRALELDKQAAATITIGETLRLVGMAYEAKGDLRNAVYFYRRALQVNRQTDLALKVEADKSAVARVEALIKSSTIPAK